MIKKLKLPMNNKGFTIVELLVVFSIITIIAGVGFASFASYNDSQKLTESTRLLKGMIEDARQSSISQVLPKETEEGLINCSNAIEGYRVNLCASDLVCSDNENDYEMELLCGITQNLVKKRTFHMNVEFDSATCDSIIYQSLTGEVRFIPAQNTDCQITLTNGKSTRTVTVDRAGNVRTD